MPAGDDECNRRNPRTGQRKERDEWHFRHRGRGTAFVIVVMMVVVMMMMVVTPITSTRGDEIVAIADRSHNGGLAHRSWWIRRRTRERRRDHGRGRDGECYTETSGPHPQHTELLLHRARQRAGHVRVNRDTEALIART